MQGAERRGAFVTCPKRGVTRCDYALKAYNGKMAERSITPPPRQNLSSISNSTPFKSYRNSSLNEFSSRNDFPEKGVDESSRNRLRHISDELNNRWIGPVQPEEFLAKYLSIKHDVTDFTDEQIQAILSVTQGQYKNENDFTKAFVSDTHHWNEVSH
jgi:hypothetical protein